MVEALATFLNVAAALVMSVQLAVSDVVGVLLLLLAAKLGW